MSPSISTSLRLFGVLIGIGLIAITGLATFALTQLEVSGPLYNQIANGQGVIGDIEPPPLYVVEANLDANLAARDPSRLADYKDRLASLEQQYDDRHAYWSQAELPVALKTEIAVTDDVLVRQFWQVLDGQVLPAIAAGNQAAVRLGLARLDTIYDQHRSVVQDIVSKANDFDNANAARAAFETKLYTSIMLGGALLIAFSIFIGLSLIGRQVVGPIKQISNYMTLLATGDFAAEPPCQEARHEVGVMVRALAIFRAAILKERQTEAEIKRTRWHMRQCARRPRRRNALSSML
jgi:methyl-accepting chemotaxis protein